MRAVAFPDAIKTYFTKKIRFCTDERDVDKRPLTTNLVVVCVSTQPNAAFVEHFLSFIHYF